MKIFKITRFLTNRRLMSYFFRMTQDGYLYENGWIKSFELKRPVNQEGEPVPWLTLSFLSFLEPRLRSDFSVLEYGSGNSTLYFSQRVKSVVAIEANPVWYEEIKKTVDPAVASIHLKDQSEYSTFASSLQIKFNLILIDGIDRLGCAKEAIEQLTSDGVIVLDNSVREDYKLIYELLQASGFRFIDFFGMAPGSRKNNGTTVFYRDNNCLGI